MCLNVPLARNLKWNMKTEFCPGLNIKKNLELFLLFFYFSMYFILFFSPYTRVASNYLSLSISPKYIIYHTYCSPVVLVSPRILHIQVYVSLISLCCCSPSCILLILRLQLEELSIMRNQFGCADLQPPLFIILISQHHQVF